MCGGGGMCEGLLCLGGGCVRFVSVWGGMCEVRVCMGGGEARGPASMQGLSVGCG